MPTDNRPSRKLPIRRPSRYTAVLGGIFVTAYASNISTPFLSIYRDRLDLAPAATQTIFVVYVAGIMITLLGSGPLSDRIGRRAVVLPALLLSILTSLLIIAGRDSYSFLLAGRFLLGASVGAVFSVGTAWVQDVVGPGQAMRVAFGTTVATYAGFGSGPVLSALYELLLPYPLVGPFAIHICLAGLVIAMLWPVPDVVNRSKGNRQSTDRRLPKPVKRLFATVVVPAAVWVFAFPSTSFALFPVLLSDQVPGYAAQVAGTAGALTALAGLAARPVLSRLGPGASMIAGMLAGTVGYLLGTLAFGMDQWPLVLPGAVLLGGASGTISAACLAVLAKTDAGNARGALTSAFYMVTYPGMSMPLVTTAVAARFSMSDTLAAITAAAVVGTAIVVASVSTRQRETVTQPATGHG